MVVGAAAQRELGLGIQDRLRVRRECRGERRCPVERLHGIERHVDVAAAVEVLAVDDDAGARVGQLRRRELDDELLGLRLVDDAAGVADRPGAERQRVGARLQRAAERVAVGVREPHAHRRRIERDQMCVAVAELQLVAVDRGMVEAIAAAGLEDHFQIAEAVDGLLADAAAAQARDDLDFGARGVPVRIEDRHHGALDEVAPRALHGEGLHERAVHDPAGVAPLVGHEADRHLARDEVAREQVAERSIADAQRSAGGQGDARAAEAAHRELTAVDRRCDERAPGARGKGDVDERPAVGAAQIAEVQRVAGLRATGGGAGVGPGVRQEVGAQRHRPARVRGQVGQRHDDREVEDVGGPDLDGGTARVEFDRPVTAHDHDIELPAGVGHGRRIQREPGGEARGHVGNGHAEHAGQVRAEAELLTQVRIGAGVVDVVDRRRGRVGVLGGEDDRGSGVRRALRPLVPRPVDEPVFDDDARERGRARIDVHLVAIDGGRDLRRRHRGIEGHRPVGRRRRARHAHAVDGDFRGGGAGGVGDRALHDLLAAVGDREDDGEELLGLAEREEILGGGRDAGRRRRRLQHVRAAVDLRDHEAVGLGLRHEPGGGIDLQGEPARDVAGIVVRGLDRIGIRRPGDGHRPDLAGGDAAAHDDGLRRRRHVGDGRRGVGRERRGEVEPAAAGLRDDQRAALSAGREPDHRVDLAGQPLGHAAQRVAAHRQVVVVGPVDGHGPRIAGGDGPAQGQRLRRSGQVRHRGRRRRIVARVARVEVRHVEGPAVGEERQRHATGGGERARQPVAERLGGRARADEHGRAALVEHDRAEPLAGEAELRRQVGDRGLVDGERHGVRRRREGDVDVIPVVDGVDVDGAARARIGEGGGGALDGKGGGDLFVRRAGDDGAILQRHVGVLEAAGREGDRHRPEREARERGVQQIPEPVGADLADGRDHQVVVGRARQLALLLDDGLLRQRRDGANGRHASVRVRHAVVLDAQPGTQSLGGREAGRGQLRDRPFQQPVVEVPVAVVVLVGRGRRGDAGVAVLDEDLPARTESRHALHAVDQLQGEGHGQRAGVGHDRVQRHGGAVHGDGGAVGGHRELVVAVEDRGVIERGARRRVETRVDEAPAAGGVVGGVHGADVDAAAILHGVDQRGRRLGSGRRRRHGVDHVEGDFFAGGVAEARLQLSVYGQQPHLIRNVGQEEHHDLAARDVAEVGVQLAADADAVVGEVQLADDEELAVGADLDGDLCVEDLLGGVQGIQLRAARDDHRRRERRGEAVEVGIGRQQLRLAHDLLLDRLEPLLGRQLRRQPELRVAQRERILDGGQGLEELHPGREVVDGEARGRIDHDAGRQAGADEDAEWPELAQREADAEPAHAAQAEGALHANEEDALGHRRGGIERPDDVEGPVELQDAADEPGVEVATEQLALHGDADRGDVDDRELALEQQLGRDLDALDGAGERQALDPLDLRHGQRQGQDEVVGVVLDVRPLDADGVDVDRQPLRPLEAAARGRADGQEDPEAGLRPEAAIAQEREVARLAAELERADLHQRADRLERDQLLIGGGAGVESQVRGRQRDEAAQVNDQGVDLELERIHPPVREGQLQPDGLVVRAAVRVHVVGGLPVRDRGGDRPAREEPGAAGGDEDRAVEDDRAFRVEIHLEVVDADPDVVELQEAAERDGALTGRRGHERAAGGVFASERELGGADREAVAANDQARNQAAARVVGAERHAATRARVERSDLALDAEFREEDLRAVDADQLLAAGGRPREARVVLDHDAVRRHLHHIRDDDLQTGHAQ